MRRLVVSLMGALGLLWGLLGAPAVAQNYIALVIGNADYEQTRWQLANPAKEASAVADALKEAGYDVELVTNATEQVMTDAARRMRNRLRDAGPTAVGLFYYAGHGMEAEGLNYLIPVEIAAETQQDVAADSVRLGRLLDIVGSAPSKAVIVVLNACRNAPLRGATYSVETPGMAPEGRRRNFLIAYATARLAPAYDYWPPDGAPPADGLSPYGRAFISRLKAPEPAELVFSRIGADVDDFTAGAQQPFVESGYRSSSAENDLYLTPRTGARSTPGAGTPAPVAARPPEAEVWDALVGAGASACDYADFATTYPGSVYTPLANTKAKDCRRTAATPPAPTPAPATVDFSGSQVSVYYYDNDSSRTAANDIRTRLRGISIEPANFAVIAGVCDPGNADADFNIVDYQAAWSGTPKLEKLLATLGGVDVSLNPRQSAWPAQSSDVVIALCGMNEAPAPAPAPSRPSSGSEIAGLDISLYYHETPGSQRVAETIKSQIEALGGALSWYEPIYSICDASAANTSMNVLDYQADIAGTSKLAQVISIATGADPSIQPRQTPWDQSGDVVISLCGSGDGGAPPSVASGSNYRDMTIGLYYRDTARSKSVADDIKAKFERIGASVTYFDPILAICDADRSDAPYNIIDYMPEWSGTPEIEGLISVTNQAPVEIIPRLTTWEGQGIDVVVALCGMDATEDAPRVSSTEWQRSTVVSVYHRDTASSRAVAGEIQRKLAALGVTPGTVDIIAGVCDAANNATSNILDYKDSVSAPALASLRTVVDGVGASFEVRPSGWSAQSSDIVIATCGMPEVEGSVGNVAGPGGVPEVAIYYRETASSRAIAGRLRDEFEAIGAYVPYFEEIYGVCDEGYGDASYNIADFQSEWATSAFLGQARDIVSRAEVPITVQESDWEGQTSDLVIALCGMPTEETAAPKGDAEISIYFRDTDASRRVGDKIKRDLEARGYQIARFDPIAGVCDVAESSINFADYKSDWAGSDLVRALSEVTAYSGAPITIRRSEWSAQSSDLVIALCGM